VGYPSFADVSETYRQKFSEEAALFHPVRLLPQEFLRKCPSSFRAQDKQLSYNKLRPEGYSRHLSATFHDGKR